MSPDAAEAAELRRFVEDLAACRLQPDREHWTSYIAGEARMALVRADAERAVAEGKAKAKRIRDDDHCMCTCGCTAPRAFASLLCDRCFTEGCDDP